MFHDSRELSVSRMLMLMNSTQRKLQGEENIYDSDSPLKAIQLLKIAQRLNDELTYVEASQTRTSLREHHHPSIVVTQRSIELDQEEDEEEEVEDPFLAEMQSAIEVRHVEDYRQSQSIEVEETEISESDIADVEGDRDDDRPTTSIEEVSDEADMLDEDLAEIDLHMLDEDDMPILSRQISFGSIPSLYHSDVSDEEDEGDDSFDDALDREHALPHYKHHHNHRLISHPAINLMTKEDQTHHDHPMPQHCQAPIA